MRNVIFLDIDGVFNCELFYKDRAKTDYMERAKYMEQNEYHENQICKERVKWFSEMCLETESVIVISSTWRMGKTVEELQSLFDRCGGSFSIIGLTPHTGYERGTEISKWLQDNCEKVFSVPYYDFYRYAIIDDDSDMLLNQGPHFFKTDTYSGLTPNTCYKIKRFFTHQTF